MNIGFKPHLVRDLLGLSKERFRYWRKKLDPIPKRSHFSSSDILAYRVLRTLIEGRREPVEFLSRFDWSGLFTSFSMKSLQELKGMVVTLNLDSSEVKLQCFDNIADNKSNIIIIVYLEEIITEHCEAFIGLGRDADAG